VPARPRERRERKNSVSVSTAAPTSSSHGTASTWPTPPNISESRDYASNMCDTLEYTEAPSSFRRRFDRSIAASLGRAIAGSDAQQTLRKRKKKAEIRAKRQSSSRIVIPKGGGVIYPSQALMHIVERRQEEVLQARRRAQLAAGKTGCFETEFRRQLDILASFDNPHRSIPRSERASSV
jgi:hypothetical protein